MAEENWLKREFELVKANTQRLEACAGPHDFVGQPPRYPGSLYQVYKCSLCGGEVGWRDARWYTRGFEDGKKARI